jgi:hypothetical protein
VVVDEKARAFVKMFKTLQIRETALPHAFPGQKNALVRAFWLKYDQNYGLRRNSILNLSRNIWSYNIVMNHYKTKVKKILPSVVVEENVNADQ